MPGLDETIRDFQRMIATMPTPALIAGMAEDMIRLDDKVASLSAARDRRSSPGGEERYYEAFGELIGVMVTVAVACTELSLAREAAWTFTAESGPVPGISLN